MLVYCKRPGIIPKNHVGEGRWAQLLFADEGTSTWEWLRTAYGNASTAAADGEQAERAWQPISSSHMFTPGQSDINHRLKVRCTPAQLRYWPSTSFMKTSAFTPTATVTPVRMHLSSLVRRCIQMAHGLGELGTAIEASCKSAWEELHTALQIPMVKLWQKLLAEVKPWQA